MELFFLEYQVAIYCGIIKLEAKHYATGATTKEVLWIKDILGEMGFLQKRPTKIYCDSQAYIAMTKNLEFHARTKHIKMRYHFIHDIIKSQTI
jgi:hypothetical protein